MKRLEEISEIQQGVSKGKVISPEDAISVPYMRVANVKDGAIDLTEVKEIVISKEELSKYTLFDGDILITEGGDPDKLGRGGIWTNSIKNCVFQNHLFRIRADRSKLDKFFLYNYFQGFSAKAYFLSCAKQTTGIASINSSQVKATPIPLPSVSEQKRVAAIIATWDAAIDNVQRIVDALQNRHRGLMQQLLGGKKRLNGFNENWKVMTLGEHFKFIKSYSIPRDGLTEDCHDESIFCIHYGDIHASYACEFLDFDKEMRIPKLASPQEIDQQDYLKDGDIVIADASEDYDGVGESIEVKNIGNRKAIGGLHTIVLRDQSNMTVDGFRAYLFASNEVKIELKKKANGTSVYSVAKSTVKELTIKVPPQKEQNAIGEILISSDREIQLHRLRLAALQEQKRGLMQVLLTGKVRVKMKEE